ncbi:MAG: transcriptional repressor [Polyangiaceae bacterium]
MTPAPDGGSVETLRALLRGAGLRATGPRIAVLRQLSIATSPISHSEVASSLSGEGLDRATVYRNLMDLTDAGLARRTDLGDHTWRFELVREQAEHTSDAGDHHAHFMCNTCGDVVCLPEESVQIVVASRSVPPPERQPQTSTPARRSMPRAIKQRAFEVQLKGRCDRCT